MSPSPDSLDHSPPQACSEGLRPRRQDRPVGVDLLPLHDELDVSEARFSVALEQGSQVLYDLVLVIHFVDELEVLGIVLPHSRKGSQLQVDGKGTRVLLDATALYAPEEGHVPLQGLLIPSPRYCDGRIRPLKEVDALLRVGLLVLGDDFLGADLDLLVPIAVADANLGGHPNSLTFAVLLRHGGAVRSVWFLR